jgi:hypothetical protein
MLNSDVIEVHVLSLDVIESHVIELQVIELYVKEPPDDDSAHSMLTASICPGVAFRALQRGVA